jgi:hypothetical protein
MHPIALRVARILFALAPCLLTAPFPPLSVAQGSTPDADLTPTELAAFEDSPTYAETMAYLHELAADCPHIKVSSFGFSTEGLPLPVVFVWDRSGPHRGWDDGSHKPVVLVTAGIHSGEICGKDALLMLLRDIARGRETDILHHLRLVFVPIFNVDGHERHSLYNRFTQNGPASGYGTRRNALGLDLNRDYAKLESPECQALVRLAAQFQPHIYIDLHTDDGMGHQYDMLFSPSVNPTFPGVRGPLVRDKLIPYVVRAMDEGGFRCRRIGWPVNSLDPTEGIAAYGISTRIGTGYFETRQCISILTEAYPYAPYERRVRATDAFVRAVLGFAVSHRISVYNAVERARAEAVQWGRAPGVHEIGLGCRADRTRGREIRWRGKVYEIIPSEVTGGNYALYSDENVTYKLPYYDVMVPRVTVTMPRGYLMAAACAHVARKLQHHMIDVERLTEKLEIEVEVFRIPDVEFGERPYQGHHLLSNIEGTWTTEVRAFPPGTYWIPADQVAGLTAMHLLEPESPDALLVWNAFDTIFERGIVLERWALEENARRLLEDPLIRAEYEAALTDSAFAASPWSRLEFFFQKTPYVEDRENLYPVFRVLGETPRHTRP